MEMREIANPIFRYHLLFYFNFFYIMSTRCNIILWGEEQGKQVFYKQVYHHSDGYLEGVGADLADLATELMGEEETDITPRRFACKLAGHSPKYEFENDLHEPYPNSDIEWRYDMFFAKDGITVRCEHYISYPDEFVESFEFSIKRTKRRK